MTGYTPFQKDFKELKTGDLKVLKEVPEGWYVEYKRIFPGIKSAAKSLSAFANSYGGWLFYGIEEDATGKKVAGSFPGIPTTGIPLMEQQLQQAASTQVNPAPYYEVCILNGPDNELGLPKEHSVAVIRIPQGMNAPYLHGSGRIYRRVADASDPTHETDRHLLDLLWRRGHDTRKRFSKFVRTEPEISEAEKNTTYIKLFIFPDPWGERNLRTRSEFGEFSSLMSDATYESGGIPFDNIYSMSTGYVARQTRNNNPYLQLLTWKYYFDCVSEITLPLNGTDLSSYPNALKFLMGYDQRDRFLQLCNRCGLNNGRLVDLSQLFSVLISVVKRQSRLMIEDGYSWPLYVKAQITNAWRRVPFIDMKDVMDFFESYGIPLVQEDKAFVPSGTEPDSCIALEKLNEPDEEGSPYYNAGLLLALTAQSFGIPHQILGFGSENKASTLEQLIDMGERAKRATSSRS
jgi:Schlafen, AlbA_2